MEMDLPYDYNMSTRHQTGADSCTTHQLERIDGVETCWNDGNGLDKYGDNGYTYIYSTMVINGVIYNPYKYRVTVL